MGKATGFLEVARAKHPARPVTERLRDWREVYVSYPEAALTEQAARCMDCGIPFCHHGCPLGNVIPDWNDLVYRNQWRMAIDRLHATNNFPEFTGRLCPAPCEGACVLGINNDPVTIKSIEVSIVDRAFDQGWIAAKPPARPTGKSIAVVGSGPAGLAAADQLNRAGHLVTVLERADRIGGLLRYGIPAFKLEKRLLDRRLQVLSEEGITFRTGCHIGIDMPVDELRAEFDAVVLAGGATQPRDLPVPGRDLAGIHFAMEYLSLQNRRNEGDDIPDPGSASVESGFVGSTSVGSGFSSAEALAKAVSRTFITAKDKHVVIIGGGDTGADCLGTAHRQGARAVHQLELLSRPPDARTPSNPWPLWPNIFRVSTAHEEGGDRLYAIATQQFIGDARGRVTTLRASRVETVKKNGRLEFNTIDGSEFEIQADLVLLAMGFLGPERDGMLAQLGVRMTDRGTVWRDERWMTSVPGVFTAGDMQRGQSLIVWAIAEGRSCARGVDAYLMDTSDLPAPLQ